MGLILEIEMYFVILVASPMSKEMGLVMMNAMLANATWIMETVASVQMCLEIHAIAIS